MGPKKNFGSFVLKRHSKRAFSPHHWRPGKPLLHATQVMESISAIFQEGVASNCTRDRWNTPPRMEVVKSKNPQRFRWGLFFHGLKKTHLYKKSGPQLNRLHVTLSKPECNGYSWIKPTKSRCSTSENQLDVSIHWFPWQTNPSLFGFLKWVQCAKS